MYLIGVAVVVTLVTFIILGFKTERTGNKNNLYRIAGWRVQFRCILAVLLGAIIISFGSVTIIEANRIGVVYDPFKKGTQDIVLQEGLNFKAPWQEVYIMSTSVKLLTLSDITVQTKGGQWLQVEMEVQLSISPQTAMLFYRKYRNISLDDPYLRQILSATVQREVENIVVKYDVMDVMGEKKSEINIKVDEAVARELGKDGILVTRAIIKDADAGEEIEAAIKKVKVAELAVIESEQLKQRAINEGEAKIKEAEAQAKVNALLQESLTTIVLQDRFIQKWNGILPVVFGQSGSLFDISNYVKK